MNQIENLKAQTEDLNTSFREVEARLSDAKRDVDQQQHLVAGRKRKPFTT